MSDSVWVVAFAFMAWFTATVVALSVIRLFILHEDNDDDER